MSSFIRKFPFYHLRFLHVLMNIYDFVALNLSYYLKNLPLFLYAERARTFPPRSRCFLFRISTQVEIRKIII